MIDVSSELTEAMRESRQAPIRLRETVKSANLEEHRAAMKECLAAWAPEAGSVAGYGHSGAGE